ncbi:peptidyl-prolyl cis-trans isomerase [Sedimentibacter sp.]|uniref:peptidylprolyl isomerase n=1 Tax=Sedimentibacter sp. TaxID=1960295 RepID=UPI00289A7E69|nr:peptidyl-prolyl cis-trans isomerase [Sedimentibacter sp.]
MSANNNSHNNGKKIIPDAEPETNDPHMSDENSVMADLLHVLGIKKKAPPPSASETKPQSELSPSDNFHNNEKHSLEDDASSPLSEPVSYENNSLGLEYRDETDPEDIRDISCPEYKLTQEAQNKPVTKKSKIKIFVFLGLVLAGGITAKFAPYIFEPEPPNPDVVGSYNGKNITVDQLQAFINIEQVKEREHMLCPVHGYDHSKCDSGEECESHPIDSLAGYQELITRLAVEQMIQEWADAKGVTQREDVQHGMKDLLNDITVEQYIAQLHDENITPETISNWEIKQYYDENQNTYTGKPLPEVEDEIRQILASKKDEDFFPQYIEELKQTAGLQVNFDILKVDEPTDDEISAYYEENIADFQTKDTAKYSEIRIATGDAANSAKDAIRKIRSGESFESVASSFSKDGNASTNTVVKGSGNTALEDAIWKMKAGDISDSINNADGSVSIVKLIEATNAGIKSLDSVKSEIRSKLLAENMETEYTLRKSEMLFSIHSRRYTLGEFYTEFKELSEAYQSEFSTYNAKKQLVEQMIAQELLLEKSGDKSSGNREEHSYEEMKIQYLAQILHRDEVDENLTEPAEEEIRQFYENNKENLINPAAVQLNIIWIDQGQNGEKKEQALQKANEALNAINSGVSFEEAAKQYSEDSSAASGGQIEGDFYMEYLIPPLADAAFTLKIGEVSKVLEYSYSYYILQVRDRTEEQQQSYEQASEGIKTHLSEQQHAQLQMDMEKTMLDNANFTVYNKTIRRLLKENESQY